MKDTTNRIPTLDGWRGIAILCVIIAHFQAGYFLGRRPFHDWQWLILGGHGVAIFFVLSGYLITSRLFAEGEIGLKRFYMRRFFRLMPTVWAYLAFLLFLGFIRRTPVVNISELLSCLFFYRNFVSVNDVVNGAFTGHFWTLSVEEQFYLCWPAILAVGGRRALWLALCSVLIFGFSAYTWCYSALFVGCVLAFAARETEFRAWIQRYHLWLFPLCLFGLAWHVTRYHNGLIPLSETLLIALLLACTSFSPSFLPSRVLGQRHLKEIGACSYSLYVWQEFLLVIHSGFFGLIFLPLVGVASYSLIEQPGICFGARLLTRLRSREQERVVLVER